MSSSGVGSSRTSDSGLALAETCACRTLTGLNVDTLARGRVELSQDLAGRPTDRV